MSEGVQITIPDFEESDYKPPTLFGALAAVPDSPTLTPVPSNTTSYFSSHARGDSITSLESTTSNPPAATKPRITKKPSFASIRNAFKKSNDPPPLPQLADTYARFNRSTSSLNKSPPSAFGRPATPITRKKHSQSGSIFHYSDDGHSTPPPLPIDEDKIIIDPKTPSDFALHAVFMRFASTAESKIDLFLRQPLDSDPLLPDLIGNDPKFDDVLRSLGQIAQKHTKPVLDSIMRWRRSQVENVGSEYHRPGHTRPSEVPGLLNARKALAAIYIMCKALIAVVRTLSKDAIGENLGYTLEKTTFDQFRKPDLKLLMQSANHRTNADLSAELLGHLANIRYVLFLLLLLILMGLQLRLRHGSLPRRTLPRLSRPGPKRPRHEIRKPRPRYQVHSNQSMALGGF